MAADDLKHIRVSMQKIDAVVPKAGSSDQRQLCLEYSVVL
jgi:hypothetical protein